jgi:transcriptional regulator with XRE-family HTH domain
MNRKHPQKLRDVQLLVKIALRIKELRALKDISQEDFFNITNINIARIEVAKNNITVSTLNAICKYFKISLTEFFSGIK